MSTRNNSGMPAAAHDYMLGASLRESPVLAKLRAATAPRAEAEMQIGPEQGQFMAFLVRLTVPDAASNWEPTPAIRRWPWRWPCPRMAASWPAT